MTRLTKYGSVSCLLFGLALTIPQPMESDPQQPSAPRQSTVRFKSQDGTFAIEYPSSLIRCERDPKQSDQWIPRRSCEAFMPVCADAVFTKDATAVCVAYPAENFAGTNFQAAAFSVNRLDAVNAEGCLHVTEPHPATSRKEKINGVTFDVFDAGVVATGNWQAADAYRSFHQDRCYELDSRVAFSNIANLEPGTVKEFDSEVVNRSLRSVLHTFRFLK